jgi:galactose mutarotase-like enzyme
VSYAVEDVHLDVVFELTNTGEEILPASLGGHPAFNWPLLPGLPKEAYGISFSHEEAAPIRRLKDGLLRAKPEATPIKGKFLALSEQLFADDAVILDRPVSHSIRYGADRGPAISVSWQIWSKPQGTSLLCIEPWYGFASPSDFDGDFFDKRGIMKLAPAKTQILKYRIGVG